MFTLNRGDDYKNHVKCISEDQKYGGKGYEAKANKGDIKQQQWIQVQRNDSPHSCVFVFKSSFVANLMMPLPQKVHDAMNKPGVSAKLKDVLQQVSSYDNVPRKRAKFQVGITSVYQSLAVLLNILCYSIPTNKNI